MKQRDRAFCLALTVFFVCPAAVVLAGPGVDPACAPPPTCCGAIIPETTPFDSSTSFHDAGNGCVITDQMDARGAQPVDVTLSTPTLDANGHVWLGWTSRLTATDLRPYLLDTFHRQGPAFWGAPSGMAWFDADTPRIRPVASVSMSDGVYVSGGGVGGKTPIPFCGNANYLFGHADGWLHRSTDGENWEVVGLFPATVMAPLQSGALLRVRTTTGSGPEAYRSDDDGVTWTRSVWADSGAPFSFLTPNATIVNWGVHQAQNGTIIMVEYSVNSNGRYIYRSVDDGVSWSLVHDSGFDVIHHYHAVCKQEALGRWVAITGDNRGDRPRNFVKVSDDDGVTWHDYTMPNEIWMQPTYLLEYGHPTRLLFGSDASWQVGWFDVSDGPKAKDIASIVTNWDRRPNRHTCFFMFKHDGLYYACHRIAEYGGDYPVISVSRNLTDWAVYHRFDATEVSALGFGGEWGGKLRLAVFTDNGWRSLALSPARLAERTAVVVMPASENLLSVNESQMTTVQNWVNASPPDAQGGRGAFWSGAGGMQGDGSLRYQRSDGLRMALRTPSVPYVPNQTYQARLWMRGNAGLVQMRWAVDTTATGESIWGQLAAEDWQEFITPPITIPSGVGDLKLEIVVFPNLGVGCDVWIDNITISRAPAVAWSQGGPSLSDSMFTWATVGDAWTNVLSIQTDDLADFYRGHDPRLIKSWGDDPNNDMRLVYIPIEKRFELRRYRGGAQIGQVRVNAAPFQRNAEIRFVVRANGDRMALSVANGRIQRTRCGRPDDRFRNQTLLMRWGDNADAALPLSLIDDHLYEGWVNEGEFGAILRDPNAGAAWAPAQYRIERRVEGGDWVTIGAADAGASSFVDADAPYGATYRVVAEGAFGAAPPSNEMVATLPGDLTGDGAVDVADLAAFLATFSRCQGDDGFDPAADLTGDGCASLADLSLLLGRFGRAVGG